MQKFWFDLIAAATGGLIWLMLVLILGEERAKKAFPIVIAVLIGVVVCVCLVGVAAVCYLAARP